MNKKGYTVAELVITFGIFGIAFFIAAGSISNVFNYDYKNDLYNMTIAAIEDQASLYGKMNPELFEEEKSIYVTIDDLAQANAVISYEDGKVLDPRDNNKKLNDIKVKITKESDDAVTAKVLM